jgi:tRNA(Arg) A34 adenosine deaminase TadA
MCLAAAYWAHIPRVVYAASKEDAARAGFDDADLYREVGLAWDGRRIVGERLLADEGRAVLEAWASNSRRREY